MKALDYPALGARVRQRRRALNLTQAELADRMAISASFLGHIERGTRSLSVDTLMSLCHALDLTPNDLLGEQVPPSARPDSMELLAQELLQAALALLRPHP